MRKILFTIMNQECCQLLSQNSPAYKKSVNVELLREMTEMCQNCSGESCYDCFPEPAIDQCAESLIRDVMRDLTDRWSFKDVDEFAGMIVVICNKVGDHVLADNEVLFVDSTERIFDAGDPEWTRGIF